MSQVPKIKDRILGRFLPDGDLPEIVSGTSWTAVLKVIGLGVAYLFSLVVARRLGPEAWGLYVLSITVLSFCALLSRMGLDTSLVRLTAVFRAQGRDDSVLYVYLMTLRVALPISLLLSLVLLALAPTIANRVFSKPQLTPHLRVAALAILPLTISYLNWEGLRGLKKTREYAAIALLARHLFPLLILLTIFPIFQGNLIVIISLVISTYFIAGLSTVALIKYGRFRSITPKADISYGSLMALGIPLLLASSLGFIRGWIDTFMLGIYMSETDVGTYNIALRLALFISLLLTATSSISSPMLAESFNSNDEDGLKNTAHQASKLSLLAGLPIFLILVIMPEFWLGLFGDEFRVASSALIILSIAQLFNAWSGATGNILQMTGHQLFFQNITLFSVVLAVVLNYVLIPRYGINGAALSTSVSIIVWNLGCAVFIRSRIGISVFYNPLQKWTEWTH